MRAVILAGGYGTRISEESETKPKPMVEIGNRPILWHIMKIYSAYGINDFIICAGYKQHVIKEYFADYFLHTSDITFDYTSGTREIVVHDSHADRWKVTVVDTGLDTMTGGRVKRIGKYLDDEPFMLTYGDGVGDVDLDELLEFHRQHHQLATLTSYNPGQRFGVLDIDENDNVRQFREKSEGDGSLINIGFMVLEPSFLNLIDNDQSVLEQGPLQRAARLGQLNAYYHAGFWQCMDTLREKQLLEKLWNGGNAPWKVW